MSSPLSFTNACRQLGNAAYDVGYATLKAPFKGGKIRLIMIGLPVLFIAAGTGAAIYAIMNAALGFAGNKCTKAAKYIERTIQKTFYHKKHIRPIHPNQDSSRVRRPEIPQPRASPEQEDEVVAVEVVIQAPLPPNVAKERNAALLKFLDLVDKFVIDPLIVENEKLREKAAKTEDPFLNEMVNDKKALKAWLRAITLWQLGVQWDQLEAQYVKMETPAPPTLESISKQLQPLPAKLRDTLRAQITSEGAPDVRVVAFQKAITESNQPTLKKVNLFLLSVQLDEILNSVPKSADAKSEDQKEIQQRFAIVMHNGMAVSLTEMSIIIEGWFTVIQQLSPPPHVAEKAEVQRLEVEEEVERSRQEVDLQRMVEKTSNVLSGELSKKYLLPLWNKQETEWEQSVRLGLGIEEVAAESTTNQLADQFTKGLITEKAFLEAADSHCLSTSLTSSLSFLRAIRYMEARGVTLQESIEKLPTSLLLQLQPMLVSTLNRTVTMLSEISLKRTVPKVVKYGLELLDCCRALQDVRNKVEPSMEDSVIMIARDDEEDSPLTQALTNGKEGELSNAVAMLCAEVPERLVSGRAVIDRLGSSAHKAVRLSEPEVQEGTWIRTTKERVEGLLRVRAAEYSREPGGEWLTSLLENKSNGSGTNLIGSLLSLQNKLWGLIPGAGVIVKILGLGVQTFIEEAACEATQKGLNDITSTGFLSTHIAINLVNSLVDQSKEEKKWKVNLPMLQQAYTFLQPEEQELVIKHLKDQCGETELFAARRVDLMTPPGNSFGRNKHIAKMKREEDKFSQSLDSITRANKELNSSESPAKVEIAALEDAYHKLKRKKDLKQFERVKGLVLYVADAYLGVVLNFTGGDSLKQIIIAVIHEAYTLLSYQEIVKHWIFTIVDLLLDELEEGSAPKKEVEVPLFEEEEEVSQTKSLLEFIEGEQKQKLLNQLVGLMETSSDQEGWFNVGAWINMVAQRASYWGPGAIWGWIESAAKDKLRVTPPELTSIVLEKFEKFAIDPKGLSDMVLQGLTKNVASPHRVLVEEIPDE